jgi:hypothetical protein
MVESKASVQTFLTNLRENTEYLLKNFDLKAEPKNMTEQDLVVWKVIKSAGGDEEENDEVSKFEFINNYKKY